MTLTEFLLARIAEDEAAAHAAQPLVWYSWFRNVLILGDDTDEDFVCQVATKGDARHIARHDPSRVLAECEAKRRIVDDPTVRYNEEHHGLSIFAQRLLGLLALPYADHPDYLTEWAPHDG